MKSPAWDFGGDIVHDGGLPLKCRCFSFCPAAAPPVRAAIVYGPEQRQVPGTQHTRAQGSETDVLSTQPACGRAGLRTRTNKGRRAWALRSEYTLFPGALFAFVIFFFYALDTCCDFEMSLRTLNEKKLIADDTLLRFLQTLLGFWILCRYLNQSTDPVQSSHLAVLPQGTTKDKLWLYSHVLSKTLTSILRP